MMACCMPNGEYSLGGQKVIVNNDEARSFKSTIITYLKLQKHFCKFHIIKAIFFNIF